MFADNWKISLRQVKRLLILDIFGLSSLLLPGMAMISLLLLMVHWIRFGKGSVGKKGGGR